MPDLSFDIRHVTALPYAAIPKLAARLHIQNTTVEQVQSISLNCQTQIEPLGRAYTPEEESRLLDLFGERERWGRTMKPMFWDMTVLKVPAFADEIEVDLPLPCSLDFDVAATKYFYGLQQGSVKASVLFSGTVFHTDESGSLQVAQIPWDREVWFRIPLATWKAAVEAHYPNSAWLRLSRETFDRLYRYKLTHATHAWDRLIEHLLEIAEAPAHQDEFSSAVSARGKRS